MKYELAIFDLDGTILYTLEDLKNSVNFALTKNGFSPRSIDEVRMFVGNGIKLLIKRAVPQGTDEPTVDAVFADFNSHYAIHCADNTHPYDGIIELLTYLKDSGIKTAVVSNKADYAVRTLCRDYFDSLFDFYVGEKQGIRKKPSPDSVNAVLEMLNVSKDKAVYIGDSDVDVQTAKNAQMDCISVSWGFRDGDFLLANGATNIVDDVKSLKKELLK